MTEVLVEHLNNAQSKASGINGSDSPNIPGEVRGMGSVRIIFNPYESKWMGKADWSDSSSVKTEYFDSPADAAEGLVKVVHEEFVAATWSICNNAAGKAIGDALFRKGVI